MRVLIVDDHELFRAGLALLLRDLFPDIELLHASPLSQGMDHALGELLNIVSWISISPMATVAARLAD